MPCEKLSTSSCSQRVELEQIEHLVHALGTPAPSRPYSPAWNRRNSPAVSFS